MKHFEKSEFTMGNENVFEKMDSDFLDVLDILREKVGEPIFITSSYRTEAYNKKINGAKRSMHLQGRAIDCVCIGGRYRKVLVREALNLGLTVGVGSNFLHIDNRIDQILFHYY